MKNKFLILTLVCLVLAAVVIVGINTTGLFYASQSGTVKIGVALPMTGEAASWGSNALAGIQLATDEVNSKGGINGNKIELVVEDTKCSPESVTAYNKLINVDGVVATLGPICSSEAQPAMPIVQENKVPTIIVTASAPDLTQNRDYVFRVYPSDSLQGKFTADYIYNNLGKRKVAIIYTNDDWGKSLNELFSARFEELGGKIVYSSGVDSKETEIKIELAKAVHSGADIIYLPLHPANLLGALKGIQDLEIKLPIVSGDGAAGEEITKSGLSESILFTESKLNLPDDFVGKIKSQSAFDNLQVTFVAALGYDSAKIMFDAISKAGSTSPEAIRDALQETNYSGISNPVIQFDAQGDIKTGKFEVRQILNKESVVYYSG